MSGDGLAARAAAYCDRMGLDADDPVRGLCVMTAAATDDATKAAARIERAAEIIAAASETGAMAGAEKGVRAGLPRLVVPVTRLRVALYVAVPLLAAGLGAAGGWTAGRRVPAAGGQRPWAIETLLWNDLGAAIDKGAEQPRQNGRRWKLVPWWIEAPPQPALGAAAR